MMTKTLDSSYRYFYVLRHKVTKQYVWMDIANGSEKVGYVTNISLAWKDDTLANIMTTQRAIPDTEIVHIELAVQYNETETKL